MFEPTLRRKLARLVDTGLMRNGIVFMAKRNYEYNQALLAFSQSPLYLPIPIDTPTPEDLTSERHKPWPDRTVHVGWLSRLASEKMPALYRLIDDVQSCQTSLDSGVHLHIIGDGPELSTIMKKCAGMSVTFAGRLTHSALSNYIQEHIDVGFAMGTSALEFAVRGVPAVLTSAGLPQDNLRQDRAYRWLFDSEGFDITAEETSLASSLKTFKTIVSEVRNEELGRQYAQRCATYALAQHDLSNVGMQFAQKLASCSFTWLDMKQTDFFDNSTYKKALFGLKSGYKQLRMSVR